MDSKQKAKLAKLNTKIKSKEWVSPEELKEYKDLKELERKDQGR